LRALITLNGALKLASAAKTLPVRRWHARQWHTPTPRGSPSTSMRSWPQEHEALLEVIGES
jgi:hypothetical protein